MLLNRGVFLDLGSVDGGDLDLGALERVLPVWRWYEHTPPETVRERVAAADVVISNKCPVDAGTMAAAPRLKLIVVAATGTNNVDLDAARKRHVMVCNARDYATEAVTQAPPQSPYTPLVLT